MSSEKSSFLSKIGSIFNRKKTDEIEDAHLLDLDDKVEMDGEIAQVEPIDLSQFQSDANSRLREIMGEHPTNPEFGTDSSEFITEPVEKVVDNGIDGGVSDEEAEQEGWIANSHSNRRAAGFNDYQAGEIVEAIDEDVISIDSLTTNLTDDTGHTSRQEADEPHPVRRKIYRPDGTEMAPHRFGEHLLSKSLVSVLELDAASREQSVTGDRIGQILVAGGFLSDKDRVTAILETSSERISQENVARSKIPVDILEDFQIMISAQTEGKLYVSTSTNQSHVKDIIHQYYGPIDVEFVSFDPTRFDGFISQIRKTDNLEAASQDKADHLNRILYRALGDGASDIHIMPRKKSYSVMFRILGVRRIIHEGKLDEYNTMLAQVKDKASMDLAEKRKPQDGGFNIEYAGKGIDFRVATNPTAEGEVVVMRVLDPDRVQPSLGQLGITDVLKWRKGFNQQHGLCLICGPTGSGKTTTLNSSIREINRFEKAIYTIEDPVEYRIPYITQMSVNPAVGLTFASAIRAFMRSDPDVIVLGEVRDEETARNMIKAADTGHLVLATLHTGSIVGALSRLRDLGVPPRELRYLLRSVLVQTLVRTTCQVCDGVGHDHDGKVCFKCNGSRYTGRTVVSECEFFEDPTAVDKIINSTEHDVERTWPTMVEDAVKKMREGKTDEYELTRVFGAAVEPYLRGEQEIMELPSS